MRSRPRPGRVGGDAVVEARAAAERIDRRALASYAARTASADVGLVGRRDRFGERQWFGRQSAMVTDCD